MDKIMVVSKMTTQQNHGVVFGHISVQDFITDISGHMQRLFYQYKKA